MRFIDVSAVMHELVPNDHHSARLDGAEMFDEGITRSGTSSSISAASRSPLQRDGDEASDFVHLERKKRAEKNLKTVMSKDEQTGELRLRTERR